MLAGLCDDLVVRALVALEVLLGHRHRIGHRRRLLCMGGGR
jgi:hypothetical protein